MSKSAILKPVKRQPYQRRELQGHLRCQGRECGDLGRRRKRYIDFAAGYRVVNTGHRTRNHGRRRRTGTTVRAHLLPRALYESYVRLAERLNALAPAISLRRLCSSQPERSDRETPSRSRVIHTKRSRSSPFSGGFHGRTLMTMALTGKVDALQAWLWAVPGGVYHAEFPLPYRGVTSEQALAIWIGCSRRHRSEIGRGHVIEPVQGEGGFNVAPFDFLRALRRVATSTASCSLPTRCRVASPAREDVLDRAFRRRPGPHRHGPRAGRRFPLSGVTGRAAIMDSAHPGGLGDYGGIRSASLRPRRCST